LKLGDRGRHAIELLERLRTERARFTVSLPRSLALAMSAERVEHQAQPLQVLGWL